jgi:hypothetical protein
LRNQIEVREINFRIFTLIQHKTTYFTSQTTTMEELAAFFNHTFNINQIYSRQEIIAEFNNAEIVIPNSRNPMAFTYNRWNLGMTVIFPVFEHIGSSNYKYLGPEYPYNGFVYHYPNDEEYCYVIAEFKDGKHHFVLEGISNLNEWRDSERPGELVVSLNCYIILDSTEGKRFKCLLVTEVDKNNNSTNGFGHVSINSKLGNELIMKKVNEKILIGDTNYTIISISKSPA